MGRMSLAGSNHMQREAGFTYSFVLGLIAASAITAFVVNRFVSTEFAREKESELLYRGLQYHQAIKSYYESGGSASYPSSLELLLKDPRFPHKVHLRSRYPDPFCKGDCDWETITNDLDQIVGIKSTSTKKTFKRNHFPVGVTLQGAGETYSQWHFIFSPKKTFPQQIN